MLASNDELKEKVQELTQGSQALQVSLIKELTPVFTSAYQWCMFGTCHHRRNSSVLTGSKERWQP